MARLRVLQQAAEAEAAVAGAEEYQLDQWLVDFAGLFRDILGVEPDKHLDLNAYGWEKLQRALETAVRDEKAVALFDAAATRFEEVTLQGTSSNGIHLLSLQFGCRLLYWIYYL
jgi:hypothetical protein